MFRTMTAAALAATLAAPLYAQMASHDMSELIRTRDITGGPVYSVATSYDEATWNDTENASWDAMNWGDTYNQIGEIEDVILDQSGQMIGIVAEVGGFLDIGDKHVMVPVEDLRLVPVDDTSYSYVTRLSEEQLEEMEGVDEGWFD
ncbi:MAG: PRC-barrel domain-containing protein [Pseudomonadota bacterium]